MKPSNPQFSWFDLPSGVIRRLRGRDRDEYFSLSRPRKRLLGPLVLLVGALLLTSCDQQKSLVVSRPVVPAGDGVVEGTVSFNAPPPPVRVVGGECCPGVAPAVDESIVVDNQGDLANVVVFVENGPNVAGVGGPMTVDQKGCAYHPHVSAGRVGQTINVTSHDAVMHNVHVIPESAAQQNFSETTVGASHPLSFDAPDVVHFKCDVHPWMSAYIDVFDHPFFAVTDAAGHFRIDRLPAGTYTLVARHELLGELRQTITVASSKMPAVAFTFSPS